MGESAIVFACGERSLETQRRLWVTARIARAWPNVREAVPGAGNLTVIFDRHGVTYEALAVQLRSAWASAAVSLDAPLGASPSRTIEIPVRYGDADGPDLLEVAHACALTPEEVIARHAAATYVVSFLGFLPGFGYLDGLDPRLHLPRRAEPRTRVAAGSVAIAGTQSGIYPVDSPGGWHVIGRTQLRMFDPACEPFTLLEPGDAVRFVAQ